MVHTTQCEHSLYYKVCTTHCVYTLCTTQHWKGFGAWLVGDVQRASWTICNEGSSNAKNKASLSQLNTLISQSNTIAIDASFISVALKLISKKVKGAAFNNIKLVCQMLELYQAGSGRWRALHRP